MKAVNLIPTEERRGAGGAGKSGGAIYVVLGALALLVVALAAHTLAGKTIDDRKSELAGLQQQLAAEQQRAAELQTFATFTSLREKRVQTVSSLAASRFDWGAALHEVSRVVPTNVWLTQLTATVAPGVSVGGGSAGGLRSALPVPAIELAGCTTSQPNVARTMAAMRRIDGVQRVSLASSEKTETGGASGGSDCRQGRTKFPQFALVVYFDAPAGAAVGATPATPGAPAATTTPAATPAAPGTTPAPATTPGSTPAPASSTGSTTADPNSTQTAKDASVNQEAGK